MKIQGVIELLPKSDVISYFNSRPYESQLAALASHQSQIIPSRQQLLAQFSELKKQFAPGEVPLPESWGGYRVKADVIEFWQGGEFRLHDRICYQGEIGMPLDSSDWTKIRLAP